jgi:hypothetical protein
MGSSGQKSSSFIHKAFSDTKYPWLNSVQYQHDKRHGINILYITGPKRSHQPQTRNFEKIHIIIYGKLHLLYFNEYKNPTIMSWYWNFHDTFKQLKKVTSLKAEFDGLLNMTVLKY